MFQTDSDRINLSLGALRLEQKQHNFSQEFNFSGPADRSLSWIAGLYYYHSNAGNPYFTAYTNDAPNGTVGSSFSDTVKTDSYAGYGELTWNATDDLHFTAGGRYTSETKEFRFDDLVRPLGLRTADVDETWGSPTFRGVVRYDLADDANVYVSVSNGFKSGVYNAYALPAVPVDPEKIMAYEVGAKARVAGITFSAAAFAYDYKNIQVQGNTLVGNAFVVTLANAAKAKIRGCRGFGERHDHREDRIQCGRVDAAESGLQQLHDRTGFHSQRRDRWGSEHRPLQRIRQSRHPFPQDAGQCGPRL